MEKRAFFLLTALASSAAFAVPTVSDVTWSQPAGGGRVTITYRLTGAPAVVTLDILTNANDAAEGVSIGAKNMWNVQGDVNRYLAEDKTYTITWQPHKSWPDQAVSDASARAKVTAYDPAHPPAYMVIDLSGRGTQCVNYYECEDALPGGVESDVYRTTKMAFRRIDAAGVPWTFGVQSAIGGNKDGLCCSLTLADDFYMGIFEVTRAQWTLVCADTDNGFEVESAMRPQTKVSWINIRGNAYNAPTAWGTDRAMDGEAGDAADARNSPNANSFLGRMRTRTGVKVNLPSESQWEFAAQAGHGAGYWGDGAPILGGETCANLDLLGRYAGNGGTPAADSENYGKGQSQWTTSSGTAKVGSYGPNDWGLYDMHGNVREQCRDYWCTKGNAAVAETVADVYYKNDNNQVVVRGGGWRDSSGNCVAAQRAPVRWNASGEYALDDLGFRVTAPVTAVK